mmetsp:Transcript_65614/g.211711  ORF Transcript_65614/g.211711 Transcript_65614/m.211711 type:complete len:324 (-) Transcript_65614:567-1538(-)
MSIALHNFISASSGAAGAAASTVILYPLDVLKTNLNRGVDHKGQKYLGPLDVVKRMLAVDGLLGFYKGLGTRTSHQTVQKFAFYYVYDGLRRVFQVMRGAQKVSLSASLVIGYIAGVVTVLVANPLEVLSTRQQLSARVSSSGPAVGTLTRLVQMAREEGIGVFYRGSVANFVLAINPAIENTLFDQMKDWFLQRTAGRSLTAAQAFWFGAIAKIVATAMTFPYIRAKVIIQAAEAKAKKALTANGGTGTKEPEAQIAQQHHTPSTLQVLQQIVLEDGFMAMWKGMAPQAVKAVLSSAVLLAAKEKIQAIVKATILSLAGRSQ